MKHEAVMKSSVWSQLPVDISEVIMDRLYYYDQIQFRFVCKNWHAAQHRKQLAVSSPWVVIVRQPSIHMFECQLYEQSSFNLMPIAVDYIYLDQFVSSYPLSYNCGIKITCKYGWLLFSIPDDDYRGTTFLYFSPLTKKSIVLPHLYHRLSSHSQLSSSRRPSSSFLTAFSMEPDSPNCVLLVLEYDGKGNINISTFRQGETRWSFAEYTGISFRFANSIILCVREIFYFVNISGEVASYNTMNGHFEVEGVLRRFSLLQGYIRCMFETNGEIVLGYYDLRDRRCYLNRLDWSKKVWVPLHSLEDQTLFVSRSSFFVLAVGEQTTGNGILANKIYFLEEETNQTILSNKIYFRVDLSCHVYSVENGEKVNYMNVAGSNWCEYADHLEKYKTFWLEPPEQIVNRRKANYNNEDEARAY